MTPMPSWFDYNNILNAMPSGKEKGQFIYDESIRIVKSIAEQRECNVLYYASGFMQEPQAPGILISINPDDINGFMAGVHGHDFSKRLLLILHTPGGSAEAAETIVEYLRSKFPAGIDVAIPTYAMSAGTMIALGCDNIIMGRQSQLGPTDPQLIVGDMAYSAHSIVDQFEEARRNIDANPARVGAWAPILGFYGPALLQNARNAIAYGQELVQDWLVRYMFSDMDNPAAAAKRVAEFFGGRHASHGRRIDRRRLEDKNVEIMVAGLEDSQDLQDRILSLYHLSTIAFAHTTTLKSVISSNGTGWGRNLE